MLHVLSNQLSRSKLHWDGRIFWAHFWLRIFLGSAFLQIIESNQSPWNLRLLRTCNHRFQLTLELIICVMYLSVWSLYPRHALILGDVLVTVQQSTWINTKWWCSREFILLLLCSILFLTVNSLYVATFQVASFHCACCNANYSC